MDKENLKNQTNLKRIDINYFLRESSEFLSTAVDNAHHVNI